MKKIVLFSFLISYFSFCPVKAQNPWTLRQCANYAIEHNISIKQKEINREKRELQLSTAKNSRLPNLSATASESFSFGRGLTLDNTYTNRSTNSTSLSLGTTVPLFTGFQIPNQIKLNQLNLEAATQDLEKARNDIRMQVAQAYVQILYNMEIADVSYRQIEIDSMQVKRLQAFVNNGKASQAQLSQQEAQLAQSRLTATQANNKLQLSLLSLSQLLELPSPDGFTVARPDVERITMSTQFPSPDAIYQEAVTLKPEVQAERLRLSASERQIAIARAGLYPTLNFSGGLQTNYYKTNGMQADAIFSRFQVRNNIRSAKLDRANQQLQLDNIKKTLYKEIQQVFYNAIAAESKYKSSQTAALSSKDAFELTQAKYENGKANITEFNEAKNNYLKAESDLVQARYEHLYQLALVDFYRGKELNF